MKKTIILFLILLSIVALVVRFTSTELKQFFGINTKSGLSITTSPDGAVVFLDGNEMGKTPYENKQLEVKEYLIKLQKDDFSWQGKVKLIGGSLIVINRELSKEVASSAGEILSLDKGKGITVISNPSQAEVEVDGKNYGKTPVVVNADSGDHTILLSYPSYLKRSIKANLPKDYNLTISVDLALSEADLAAVTTPAITNTPMVVVKNTPTGFLRVRDKPNIAGKEITQVKPGDELVLLEELSSWFRVKLSDGSEGYISSTYAQKK